MAIKCPVCKGVDTYSPKEFVYRCNACQSEWTEFPEVYAVDFDGYLCKNAWPGIGEPNLKIIEHFRKLKTEGNKLILWTCREGKMLMDAICFCAKHGLYFDAVNANLPERIALYASDPRKIGADHYCDDRNYPLMPEGT